MHYSSDFLAGFLFGENGLFGWERWGAYCKTRTNVGEWSISGTSPKCREWLTVCEGLVWGFLGKVLGLYDMERRGIWYKRRWEGVGFGIGAGNSCASQSEGAGRGKSDGRRPSVRRGDACRGVCGAKRSN